MSSKDETCRLKRRPYIHPSQGDEATEYFKQLIFDKKATIAASIGGTIVSASFYVAYFNTAPESAQYPSSPASLLYFTLANTALLATLMARKAVTQEQKQIDDYLNIGREYYRFAGEEMPEWLQQASQEQQEHAEDSGASMATE
jgi:hypothetical protein